MLRVLSYSIKLTLVSVCDKGNRKQVACFDQLFAYLNEFTHVAGLLIRPISLVQLTLDLPPTVFSVDILTKPPCVSGTMRMNKRRASTKYTML